MKKTSIVIAALVAAALAVVLICDGVFFKTVRSDFFAMDSYVTVEIKGPDSEKCAAEIEKEVKRLDEKKLSRKSEGSLVYSLNKNGSGAVDAETGEIFLKLFEICEKSGGAFDFTLGAVSDLWGFGSDPGVPDPDELKRVLSHSGYKKITVSDGFLNMGDKEAIIDFGATGKGIALDEIKKILDKSRVKEAVINAGGSVLLYGSRTFAVGIRDPLGDASGYIAKISVPRGCVSTSGGYERKFEENGKTYHHILDPKTGRPVENGLASATVVSESGFLSDALSTACFALGTRRGGELAKEYGCAAIFVSKDKKIFATGIGADKIEIADASYSFGES